MFASERRILDFGDLWIDCTARRVVHQETEISLTKSEFDLLVELARQPGVVLSPEALFRAVWGSEWVGDGHAVEVQISRLRNKLGESSISQRLIKTVRSAGYRFDGVPPGVIVSLEYDSQLRVTSISPKDRPFFGWDPDDVIGTYFLLAAGPLQHLSQAQAVELMRFAAANGPASVNQAYEVRCADGTTQSRRAIIEIRVDAAGDFDGATQSLH